MAKGDVPTMPLSVGDVKRISEHTGMDPGEFTKIDSVSPEEVDALSFGQPVFKSLLARGSRVRLRTVDAGPELDACVFLKKGEGCSLPTNARPTGCRMFPFSFNAQVAKSMKSSGLVRHVVPEQPCLVNETAKSDAQALTLLGTSEAEMVKLGQQREQDAYRHEALLGGEDQEGEAE